MTACMREGRSTIECVMGLIQRQLNLEPPRLRMSVTETAFL